MVVNHSYRKSIGAFTVAFLILGIFPGTLYLYSKYKDYENERDLYIANQKDFLDFFQSEVEDRFINVFSDLAYLGYSCVLEHYLYEGTDAATVEENWLLFSSTNRQYDQIRYLDRDGVEKIRVNFNNGIPVAVPPETLQDKHDRYYFSMLPEQEKPAIVISPLDLNIENGRIEVPYKPTIRFSLPLYDREGRFNGALILNYFADYLFNNLENRFFSEKSLLYVLNPEGYLLSGPDPDHLWGFMFEDKKNMTFTSLFGDLRDDDSSDTQGVYYNSQGLVLQKTINTHNENNRSTLTKIFPGYDFHFMETGWRIVSLGRRDKSILFSRSLFISLLGSLWKVELFMIILSGCLSYVITLLYLRKVRAEKSRDALRSIMHEVVSALELTSTMNDDDTGNHIKRVCRYTEVLAEEYGLHRNQVELISEMASLHDIGKISIPDHILKKKGPLDKEEWEEMKTHVTVGHKIINQLNIDPAARNIVLYHHENWDGTGYMNHLKEDEIPVEARLVSLADVYDALRTKRPYKEAFPHETSCDIILNEKGKKFDPEIIECFKKIENKFNQISIELADNVES